MQKIPITTDANQEFSTVLNGVEYKINLWWADVGQSWYISIYDSQANAVIEGSRVVFGVSVLAGILTQFVGDLYVIPIANPTASIGRDDWGTIYNLYYLSPDDLALVSTGG